MTISQKMYINTNTVYIYVHLFILFMSYLYQNGRTALYVAAENNHKDIALLLIECGCSVDVKNIVSSYRLQYQLTKPLFVVFHLLTYLQSSELASTRLFARYLLFIIKPMGVAIGLLAYWNPWNLGDQTCPRLPQSIKGLYLCIKFLGTANVGIMMSKSYFLSCLAIIPLVSDVM